MDIFINKILILNLFRYGGINQVLSSKDYLGGKGFYIARAVSKLGIPSRLTGFIFNKNGKIIEESLKKDNVITDVKFKTFGCGAAVATSSMATELIIGKTLEEALEISNKTVAEALDGLPPVKMNCSNLAEQAIKAAIDDYKKKNESTK